MNVKNIFDRILAGFLIIFFFPLCLVISILIVIFSFFPVLYKQKRIGRFGTPFYILKFRTMEDVIGKNNDNNSKKIYTFGKFLRKYKLDELPQLWNVLKGDMSFVGPRPDVEKYALMLKGEYQKILELKPGITGPASLKYYDEEKILANADNPITYNDEIIFPDKMKINLDYYYNRSFGEDIKILVQTFLKYIR